MLVLGMDTSSQAATAAVLRDGIILGEYTLNHKKTHSVKMLPLIEQLLADTELTLNDIDVFACGTGPGSFTGVRIGVATAKGFAQALGKQVVSLNTLEILCGSLPIFHGLLVPAVFARADELFCGIYQNTNGLEELLPPCVMTVNELCSYLKQQNQNCLFVGDGAAVHMELITNELKKRAFFAPSHLSMVRGASAALLGYQKAMQNGCIPYQELVPLYLRPSQAEREYREKQRK